MTLRPQRSIYDTPLYAFILFSLTTLLIVGIHSHHFSDWTYRQDEIFTVRSASVLNASEVVQWMARSASHPPGWRLLGWAWAKAFGPQEVVTRFLSTLLTALSLSLIYRSAADLFDRRVAIFAVFILGILPFFTFYAHEFRPYSLLVLSVAGMQFAYMRWLKHQNFRYALLFVIFGILALQSHFFTVYVIATYFLLTLIFARFNLGVYVRAIGLLAAIALSFSSWVLVFLYGALVDNPNVPYFDSIGNALRILYAEMQTTPEGMGIILLLLAVFTPSYTHYRPATVRFQAHWAKWFVIAQPVLLLTLVLVANLIVKNATSRALIIIMPSLAIWAALGWSAMPRRLRWILVILLLVPALTSTRRYSPNGPYDQIVSLISPYDASHDVIVMSSRDEKGADHYPTVAYLYDHVTNLPEDTIINFVSPEANYFELPETVMSRQLRDFDAHSQAEFAEWTKQADTIWLIQINDGVEYQPAITDYIQQSYLLKQQTIPQRIPLVYIVNEYRRLPDDLETKFIFGDTVQMQSWSLLDSVDVKACQTIDLESWWTINALPDENYSMTLTLADLNGVGMVRADGTPAGVLMQQWEPDRLYLDERSLAVPCETPPGDYVLLAGIYNFENGDALAATSADGAPLGDLAYLTTVHVSP